MPRPTDESMNSQHAGIGAAPDSSINLGQIDVSTIHQLDVDGATEGARALAAVFSKGADVATTVIKDKAAADEKAGAADATLGQVDPAKMKTLGMASAYADGVKRSETQQSAFKASQDARVLFSQNPNMPLMDSTDANGQTVKGLMSSVDDIFRNAFPGGAEKDPVVANLIAPIVQHTMNELTSESYKQQILNSQQTAEDSATSAVMHDIQFGSSLFNPAFSLDTLTKVYGGNARQGRDALVHSIGEAAVSMGSPQAISKFLPPGIDFGGGATLTPENQAYLDAAKMRATEAQNRNNGEAAKSFANTIADSMLQGKDPKAALHQYLGMPGANAQEGLDMYNWYYRQGKEKQQDAVDNSHTTWDMDRATASGDITGAGQLVSWLTDNGVGNTALGNKMFQRGMSNIRSFQNTAADDPDYRAGMSNISQTYSPAQNKLTGKFMNDTANSQQAGAMLDYRTLYNQFLKQPNASATDAARKAAAATKEKWGDPVEDSNGQLKSGSWKPPQSDVEQAAVIRNAMKNPAAFHASGIRSRDIDVLVQSGLVDQNSALEAQQLIIHNLSPK